MTGSKTFPPTLGENKPFGILLMELKEEVERGWDISHSLAKSAHSVKYFLNPEPPDKSEVEAKTEGLLNRLNECIINLRKMNDKNNQTSQQLESSI